MANSWPVYMALSSGIVKLANRYMVGRPIPLYQNKQSLTLRRQESFFTGHKICSLLHHKLTQRLQFREGNYIFDVLVSDHIALYIIIPAHCHKFKIKSCTELTQNITVSGNSFLSLEPVNPNMYLSSLLLRLDA